MNLPNTQALPVALVTGGARRIGKSIVEHLHAHKFRVVIHCHHSVREAQALAVQLNQRQPNTATVMVANLALSTDIQALMTQALDWGQRLDLLVNNASVFIKTNIRATADWDTHFNINVKAPFLLSQQAFTALSQSCGSIINITDIHADKPLKDYSIYCQSKAALVMQTKSLAREFAPNIRVNAIAPGAIAWPEGDNQLNNTLQQQIIDKTPLKRHGDPSYIAHAVLSLVNNPFITGQILAVDGGRSLV